MTIARVELLFLIWLVPALFLVYLHAWSRRRSILRQYASETSLAAINPDANRSRNWIKAGLMLACLTCLVVALSGIRYGYSWQTIERKGVSLIIALDCSKSMLADDIKPDRLERAKREVFDLLGMLKGDQIGLVAFAGTGFLQCPLTLDYSSFHLFLNALSPDFLPVGGTDLPGAIRTALKSFEAKDGSEKAVILITDGESTTPGVLEAAGEAAEQKVKLFCIGVGSSEGSPIPDGQGGIQKDGSGNIVFSKLDEETLKKVAALTGGTYVRSVTGDMDLDTIYKQEIRGRMEAGTLEGGRKQIFKDRYQWFLGLAIAALIADLLIFSARRTALVLVFTLVMAAGGPALAADSGAQVKAGSKAYRAEDYHAALESFLGAQVADPENPVVLYNIGNTYYRLNDFEAAQRHYLEAANRADDRLKAKSLYNLGNTSYRLDKLPEAIDYYEQALKIDPDDEAARKNIEYVKKMMEEQQQTQPDQGEEREKSPEDQKEQSGKNQADKNREKQEGQEQASSEKRQEPDDHSSDQSESNAEPKYADQADPKSLPAPPDEEREGGSQEARPLEPGERDDRPASAMDEQMLNRLHDKPGAAMMPSYKKRAVEKDW